MIITYWDNLFTGERTYQISIQDLDAQEIAFCFKEQYPSLKALILKNKIITNIECQMLFVGLPNPRIKMDAKEVQDE